MSLSLYSALLVQLYYNPNLDDTQQQAVRQAFEQENPNHILPDQIDQPDLTSDEQVFVALHRVAKVLKGQVLTDQDLDAGKLPADNDVVFLRRDVPQEAALFQSLDHYELQEARASNALFVFQRVGEYDMDEKKLQEAIQFLARYQARRDHRQQEELEQQKLPRPRLN